MPEHSAVNRVVVGSSPTGGAKRCHYQQSVDDAGGPPVPIPNTEVKPCSAEDSALATGCENRKMPTFDSEYFLCKTALRFYEPYSCVLQCVYGMGEYGLRTCCTASLFSLLKNN